MRQILCNLIFKVITFLICVIYLCICLCVNSVCYFISILILVGLFTPSQIFLLMARLILLSSWLTPGLIRTFFALVGIPWTWNQSIGSKEFPFQIQEQGVTFCGEGKLGVPPPALLTYLCPGRPCFSSSDVFLFCWAAFLSISLLASVFPVSLPLFFLFLRPCLIHARIPYWVGLFCMDTLSCIHGVGR